MYVNIMFEKRLCELRCFQKQERAQPSAATSIANIRFVYNVSYDRFHIAADWFGFGFCRLRSMKLVGLVIDIRKNAKNDSLIQDPCTHNKKTRTLQTTYILGKPTHHFQSSNEQRLLNKTNKRLIINVLANHIFVKFIMTYYISCSSSVLDINELFVQIGCCIKPTFFGSVQ